MNILDKRGGVRDAELAVERFQVGTDIGVVIRRDDRDRLAGSIAGDSAVLKGDLIDPVSLPHLAGTQARGARI